MTRRTTVLTRLAAGAGALALASVGLLASSGIAHAEDLADNVDPNERGSLTVNKWEDDGYDEKPLSGVEFTVCEFVHDDGTSIDLTNNAGWDLVTEIQNGVSDEDWPTGVTLSEDCLVQATVNGSTVFSELEVGAYYVQETKSGPNLVVTPMDPFAVTIPLPQDGGFLYDVVADPKNTLGEVPVTKTLQDLPAGAEVVPGTTTVDWTITSTIPAASLDYESLEISDALPASLAFVDWGDIKIGAATLDPDTDYDISGTTVTLTEAGLEKVNLGKANEQTLTAVITTKVLELGDHKNSATVKINGTPGTDDETGNWGAAKLKKVSSADQSELEGAVFKLYQANAEGVCEADENLLIGTDTTGSDGLADWAFFIGTNDNNTLTVCLWEETAPAGHVLPANQWIGDPSVVNANSDTATFDFGEIENHKPEGPTLPDTGAQGTWAMTVGGLLLITGAAVTLVIRRRKATH